MTLHQLTDEAREVYANAVGIPWQAWAVVVLIAAFGFLLARASEGFDPMELDRPEPERPEGWPTCDHLDGPRRCGRALGHDGEHVDPFTGTRYHSARWGGAA